MAFITNSSKEVSLAKRMGELFGHSSQLDMLVGFFYFSGVKVMSDALESNDQLRLRVLVGMDAEAAFRQLVEVVATDPAGTNEQVRAKYYASLQKIMSNEIIDTEAFHKRIDIFIRLLEENRLEMRKTREPNHAKLYIFSMNDESRSLKEKVFITGSSNFSEPGLSLRNEFNVEVSDYGTAEAQAYFDELWEDSVPLTDTEEQRDRLIAILRDQSVAACITPFEAYYLVLKNYLDHQKSQLRETQLEKILQEAHFTKYRYQVDAVAQAMNKLDSYRGVIIADVVGLGKSIIAGLIAALRGKRGLIICPPGLMGLRDGSAGGWYEYKHKFGLSGWEVWSRGDLEGVMNLLRVDNAFDMVIIDEAHNFRNEKTEDYARLAEICHGKEVVLLSATPFNNRPSDLLALLHLFSPGKYSPFVPGGDLDERFRHFSKRYENANKLNKAIAKRDWKEIEKRLEACGITIQAVEGQTSLEEIGRAAQKYAAELSKGIRQVMEKIVIRRNRLDLMSDPDWKDEIKTLSKVESPKEQFFELTEEQNDFYDRVIKDYFGPGGMYHGAIYHPQAYLEDDTGMDESQASLYHMLLSGLVQRFESSFGAFADSLRHIRQTMVHSRDFIKKMGCFLYSRQVMEKILTIDDWEEANAYMFEKIREMEEQYAKNPIKSRSLVVYYMNDGNFKNKDFLADIDSDIKLIDEILAEIARLKLVENDPKAQKLIESIKQILEDRHPDVEVQPGVKRKVLVFSAYSDTIKHLERYLAQAFPLNVLPVDGKNFGKDKSLAVKKNFDASFDKHDDVFDILLTTDKLSEGYNMSRAGVVINYDIPWNPTRVIQRVGRINRIGKKMFDKLYIFNYFPTVKGSKIVSNRQIAETKMFAIHQILGEDAQIFSVAETPTAAALFDKLSSSIDDDETISFYTEIKLRFARVRRMLEKKDADYAAKIDRLPPMVKTAWKGTPNGTYMFRRQGASFFALMSDPETGKIEEQTLEDAIDGIECTYDTPRAPFSADFWGRRSADGKSIPGTYKRLKAFKPEGLARARAGMSSAVLAVEGLNKLRGELPYNLQAFSAAVAEDIQSYGTIPQATIGQLAGCHSGSETALLKLTAILSELLVLRGADYLEKVKERAHAESIVVTVEKV